MAPKHFEIEIERPVSDVFEFLVEKVKDGLADDDDEERARLDREVNVEKLKKWGTVVWSAEQGSVTFHHERSILTHITTRRHSLDVAYRLEPIPSGTLSQLDVEYTPTGIFGFAPLRAMVRNQVFDEAKQIIVNAKDELEWVPEVDSEGLRGEESDEQGGLPPQRS